MFLPLTSGFLAAMWLVTQAASPPPASPAGRKPPARPTPATKPTPAPVFEGVVKGPDGKPVKDALVLFRPISRRWDELTKELKTDAAGRFRTVLGSASPLTVRVEVPGLVDQTVEKVQLGAPLTVTLARGGVIEGAVHDAAGQPVAGARVLADQAAVVPFVLQAGRWSAVRLTATTDGQGRYRIEGVGTGVHSLSAMARGLGSDKRYGVRAGAWANLVLEGIGDSIAGIVTDPVGRPLRGALVRAELEADYGRGSPAETADAGGRFELTGLRPGTYTVIARHPEFAPGLHPGVVVDGESLTDATLALSAGVTLSGRLLGPDGRPTSGRFELQEVADQAFWSLREILRADAGPDGAFRVDRVGPGSYVFKASAPSLVSRRIETKVSPGETSVDVGDIRLEPGLAIRGRVHTSSGAPVAEAQVFVAPGREEGGAYPGGEEGVVSEGRAEADGSFVIGDLWPGRYQVTARAHGFTDDGKVAPSGTDNVDLVIRPRGRVTGLVVDERGRPCEIYAVTARGTGGTPREKTVASTDGRFLLDDLDEETYELQVLAPDHAPASASGVKVSAGQTVDAGTIRLVRGGIVRGVVVDTAGGPVAGAVVRAGPEHDLFRGGTPTMGWTGSSETSTAPNGGFEIRGLPLASHIVIPSHPDFAAASAQVEVDPSRGPSETRLVLPRGGRIEGSIRARDGSPVAGARVSWSSRDDQWSHLKPSYMTRSGLDGSFHFDHVDAGSTRVGFHGATSTGRATGSVKLWRDVDVREGGTTSLELVLREIRITGRLTRRGAPLGGETLRFSGPSSRPVVSRVPEASPRPLRNVAVSGEDGSFELIVDEPGKYRVDVDPVSLQRQSPLPMRAVTIPDAESHTLELDYGAATVAGIVVDAERQQPVAGASVSGGIGEHPRWTYSAKTADDGRFELDVEPGEYVWFARAEGYAVTRASASASAAGASSLRLELQRALETTGSVVDAAARPVGGLKIVGRASENRPHQLGRGEVTSLPDGTFRFKGLGAGSYDLYTGSPAHGYAVRTAVAAGARDVTLTLRSPGRVHLLARFPDGSPTREIYAVVTRVGSVPVTLRIGALVADHTGRIEMSLPAGSLEIELNVRGYEGTARVTVGEGETTSAEVQLIRSVEEPE